MLKGIIIEKLREVKEGIFTEVKNKIEQIENVSSNFNYTDLKVHNISRYLYKAVEKGLLSNSEETELFRHITELEYDSFTDWEGENLSYVERSYIGRTSSFCYNSKWYGDTIDNEILEELLKGKNVLNEWFKELSVFLYSYLLETKNYDQLKWSFENEEELENFFENQIELLESFSDDLDTVQEIVNEAKFAYDYLAEYKTKENEYAIAKEYLQHELEEYYCENKAELLFEKILELCTPLNKIESLELSYSTVNDEYMINVKSNVCETNIDTHIASTHELSEHYIALVMESLEQEKENNFDF